MILNQKVLPQSLYQVRSFHNYPKAPKIGASVALGEWHELFESFDFSEFLPGWRACASSKMGLHPAQPAEQGQTALERLSLQSSCGQDTLLG